MCCDCGRKDIYGVYAEPVDPEEVFAISSFSAYRVDTILFDVILMSELLSGFVASRLP